MIDQTDPLERLRAANPVPVVDPASGTSPAAVALFRRIVAEDPSVDPVPAVRRPRRRIRRVLPVVGLVGALGAAAYAALTGDVSKPQTVACYQRADLAARTEVVVVDARGPVAACESLWAAGRFGAGAVPALDACVLQTGVVGVFPATAGDGCARLGLAALSTLAPAPPPPAPGPSAPAGSEAPTTAGDVNARFLGFRDVVLRQFVNAPCVAPDDARAIVRRELDRAGLGDWTVRDGEGGFTADRPCATLGFLPAEHQVMLVPAPPRR